MARSLVITTFFVLMLGQAAASACPSPKDPAWGIPDSLERRKAEGYDFEIAGKMSATDLRDVVELIILHSLQNIEFVTAFSISTADVITCHELHESGGCHSYHIAKLDGAWTICDRSRVLDQVPDQRSP